jgi:DNA repair protein RadC
MKKQSKEDLQMKTIRRRRSRQPATARHDDATLHHLTEIRRELAHVSMTLQERLTCFNQNSARYLSESEAAHYQPASPHIANAADVIRFCEKHFKDLIQRGLQEELHVLTLNGNHRVIRSHQVTVGLLNTSQVHPREVFRPAILDAAASIILVHNHPSGNPKPSAEDVKVTGEIESAGKLIGIKLLDHIVVAREGSTSIIEFREKRSLIG